MATSTSAAKFKQRTIRLPHSLDLSILFKDFLLYWAGWQVHLDEEESLRPPQFSKEWQVTLRGSVRGTLTLRTTDRILKTLWEGQGFKGRYFPDADAALHEMVALFATHMVRTLWKGRFLSLDPLMAAPSDTEKKPSPFQCHTYCRLFLDGEPLEIRFWLDLEQEKAPLASD